MSGARTLSDMDPLRAVMRPPVQLALSHDLYVVGLSARDADLLRDALVRGAIQVDPEVDEGVVCIPAWGNRHVSVRVLLGAVERWALEEGFPELSLRYGRRSYRLATYLRREGAGGGEPGLSTSG